MKQLRNLCVILFVCALAPNVLAQSAAWQGLDELRTKAANYLREQYSGLSDRVEIQVNPLDARLRLAQCSEHLAFDVRDLTGDGGSVSVEARCTGATPWKIYLGAQVEIYRQILVAAGPLSRGDILEASDLSMIEAPSSTLRSGYYTQPEQIIGQQLRRAVDVREPLRPALVEEPLAIARGDIVTLESGSGAIVVATRAEALANGRVGEQIRVRNLASERVIRGRIVGDGRVAANF
ncbi:flagellar basal body P-ring formation chaperone FlgA [Gilvimarinus algae]|uniref:Flagella basal body P-ring formation protein FlgA n=1 Tax=Gilvimarinus algae TaxID=3058037 RepID=A0ABT8TEU9_9GAMM|nr:flagellar basal body P-ring formation chaperone FlgA [Gilvimarinus sp. SDUM040014]MDO3382621.1 flagellar basal body P-ring formation chaperone FlgA [Gilvimarinus sp. SDUM040014]